MPQVAKHEPEVKVDRSRAEARFYWSTAEKCTLANFVPEKKEGGVMVQPEKSLTFTNRMFVTSDPKQIAFIENHPSFHSKTIRRVSSAAEAKKLTMALAGVKQIKKIESSHVERR